MKISAKIRAYYIFATVIYYLALFIVILFFNRKQHNKMRKWVSKKIFDANNITYDLKGSVDPNAQMILINHQSFLDIMFLELLHSGDLAWIAKKELFNIPFYGQTVKMPDMIAIDREDKNGLKKLIEDVQKRLKQNRIIAIFPEGTRSNGKNILPFKPGAQFIANKLDLVVQPFVINSTTNLLNIKKMLMHPGKITITALPSFKASPENKSWLKETRTKMQETFSREL